MNNFTPRAQQVLALARKEADRFHHNYVGTEHLLLGMLRVGPSVAVNALVGLGVNPESLKAEVEKQVGSGPEKEVTGNIPYTPRVKKVLALAGKEAKMLNHSFVGTEHILLGLLREGDGVAARVLRAAGVEMEAMRERILFELSPSGDLTSRNRGGFGVLPKPEPYDLASVAQRPAPASPPTTEPENPRHPVLAPYLNPREVLLWSGEPKRKLRLERKHLPLLFFAVPFLAFLFAAIAGVFISHPHDSVPTTPVAQTAPVTDNASPGAPRHAPTAAEKTIETIFFLIFFVGIFGWVAFCFASAFGLRLPQGGGTIYGVTNQRLLIVTGKKAKTVQSIHLGSVTDLRMKEWPDGLGSISFGAESPWPYPNPSRGTNALLENIAEPRKVFQIIIDVRKIA